MIYLIHPDGSGRTRPAEEPGEVGALAWSPDGRKTAYEAYRRGRGWDIHLINADGKAASGSPATEATRSPRSGRPTAPWQPAPADH